MDEPAWWPVECLRRLKDFRHEAESWLSSRSGGIGQGPSSVPMGLTGSGHAADVTHGKCLAWPITKVLNWDRVRRRY